MAIITMPAIVAANCGEFSIGQRRFDLEEMSESSGATQARVLGPPRWQLSISSPSVGMSLAVASEWEAMLMLLRGKVNHLAAWDIVRFAPRGTCRGVMTLSGAHAQGATSLLIAVTGQSGLTLLKGDWLQLGTGTTSQLFKLVADATAGASNITVTVEPPVRPVGGFAGGTSVTWDKPLCHYKLASEAPSWSYRPGFNTQTGFALDLVEQWT